MPTLTQSRSAVRVIQLSLALFVLLAIAVNVGGPVVEADIAFDDWLSANVPIFYKYVAILVVQFGDPGLFIPITVLVAMIIGWRRRSAFRAVLIVAVVGLAGATSTLIKEILPSERVGVLPAAFHAFPSTHTVSTATLLGVVALTVTDDPRRRTWALGGAIAGGLVMGAGMLLRQGHWLSDVIGGMLLATAVVATTHIFLIGR